jgi:hypothetical protein
MVTTATLNLVREAKIGELMTCRPRCKRWEASGVLVKDGSFFVVFDNRSEIGRFSDDLQPNASNGLFGIAHAEGGYEGIAFNADKQRYYLLVEARKHARGRYQALIVEYDQDFNYRKQRPADFTFKSENKGFEAVAHVRRDETDYLLALCEGNQCKCGARGRKPGGGRVQVFKKKRRRWAHTDTIALPDTLPFVDYSGMSIDRGWVAIVSQVNSMLWVGRFDEASWSWHDSGRLYVFPRSDTGAIRYGNIEGVAWINPARIVAVSDRRNKKNQPDNGLAEMDQSVHIFDIPSIDRAPANLEPSQRCLAGAIDTNSASARSTNGAQSVSDSGA